MSASGLERRIRMLQASRYVLNVNYGRLVDAQEYYQNAPELSVDENSFPRVETVRKFQLEYLRRLHNYISAYYSLAGHILRIRNHLDDERFTEEYKQNLDEFNIREDTTFLLRFRAYTQHYQLPPINVTSSYNPAQRAGTQELYIPRERLLDWNDWGKAESYVRELDENIELIPLMEGIHRRVNEFDDWFMAEVQRRYKRQLGSQSKMLDELSGLMSVNEPYFLSFDDAND